MLGLAHGSSGALKAAKQSFASFKNLGCETSVCCAIRKTTTPCGSAISIDGDARLCVNSRLPKPYVGIADIFKIGVGPSSSHTMGPMTAGANFLELLLEKDFICDVEFIEVNLFGSLALTGKGHATDKAAMLGLMGYRPASIDPDVAEAKFNETIEKQILLLGNKKAIPFNYDKSVQFFKSVELPLHPNAITFVAYGRSHEKTNDNLNEELLRNRCPSNHSLPSIDYDETKENNNLSILLSVTYYSVGGGFVLSEEEMIQSSAKFEPIDDDTSPQSTIDTIDGSSSSSTDDNNGIPYNFSTAAELIDRCHKCDRTIAQIMVENEAALRHIPIEKVYEELDTIASCMERCIERGLRTTGLLPVSNVPRRAKQMKDRLEKTAKNDPLAVNDWTALFARAVNEENACGGRVVTSPTTGAAGTLPAVLEYFKRFKAVNGGKTTLIRDFLATAAAIGSLCKRNASISGAEAGCQAEVGSACAMAAGALTAVCGGTPEQVENAAEIGLEHCLGLTCDPIDGLVQVPCIERNSIAAVKAVTASRLALMGDGTHQVSLDNCIEAMYRTGIDLQSKYRETSLGGLAVYGKK